MADRPDDRADDGSATGGPPGRPPQAAGLAALTELFGGDEGLDGFGATLDGPLYWPDLTDEEMPAARAELRAWVEQLARRFDLDAHVIPNCWQRHNAHVEALAALRDHERASYAPTAPPTAAVDWHRALRDIEGRLRSWTGELRCDRDHHPSHDKPRTFPDCD